MSELKLSREYYKWDSVTIEAFHKSDSFFSGKSKIIINSLKANDDSYGISFLNRKNFIIYFDSLRIKAKGNSDIVIFEIRSSGEVITNSKALISISDRQVYSFIEDDGKWKLSQTKKIKPNEIDEILNIQHDSSDKDIFQWGYDINDVFIVTRFSSDDVDVNPFFLISVKKLRHIERIIF